MSKMLVVLAAAAATIVGLMFWGKIFGALHRRSSTAQVVFVPDPHNDKRIAVRGWTRDELSRILDDFAGLYGLKTGFASQVRSAESGHALISFPDDLPPELFFFLVNELNYPQQYHPRGRDIAVAGKATLTPAFGIPDPALAGRSARIYVPADDTDFDLVCITLVSGESYEVSFTDLRWKRIEESRMAQDVRTL